MQAPHPLLKDKKSCCFEGHEKNNCPYWPLIVVVLFSILIPFALIRFDFQAIEMLMYPFMGFFFIFLSMFKLFDLKGFVEGFRLYDLVAGKIKIYGFFYPFIELSLGLAYLMQFRLAIVNWITFIVMLISAMGVLKSLSMGKKIKCACLGNLLNVPLGVVSLVENLSMGAMALWGLLVL